jgi:DUF4097 and DUF4098 domain-containing protein YvlB
VNRYSVIAIALLAAGSASAAERNLNKAFTVSPGGTLTVDADSASVQVTGVDSNQVTVHMNARGPEDDLAKLTFDAAQKGDGVTVTLRRTEKGSWFKWRSWSGEQRIEVKVPKRYLVKVRTGGGSVGLAGTTGTVDLYTSGGDIEVQSVTGNIQARTSGGGIHMEAVRGDVDADTSGGDVRLERIDGKIRGNTSGGSVRVSLVGANRGISATTSGGDVEVRLPPGTAGNVEASTSGGSIESDLTLSSSVTKDTRIAGTLNGGGQPIEARTSGGNVTLRAMN